jgi:hypothetical protein
MELGKQLVTSIVPEVAAEGDVSSHEASTNERITHDNARRRRACAPGAHFLSAGRFATALNWTAFP